MANKKAFWISYDLGLKGDYTGLYTWLDTIEARECGDSMAFFSMDLTHDIVETIKRDIKKNVTISKRDRIYLIHLDNNTNKMKGKFLFGKRKRAPWEGYADGFDGNNEDFAE